MFKSLTVKNFRCFEELTLNQIERVNLIGGMNNIGKTALLEAIHLMTSLDSLEIPLKLNFDRGIFSPKTFDVEEICEWLFYQKKAHKAIKIEVIDEQDIKSELKLSLEKAASPRLFPLTLNSNRRKTLKDLKLEFKTADQKPWQFTIFLVPDKEDPDTARLGIEHQNDPLEDVGIPSFPLSDFISSRLRISPTQDAERFSVLEAQNKQDEIVKILNILEPRLKRLSVLVTGGVPMINGDIGGSYLIPVSLMGEGINRLLSMVLSIMNASGGTVLIDEIENGIHYSVLAKIWESIAEASQRFNTQIFATTHSQECINSAHEAFANLESYDFRYFRLQREQNTGLIKTAIYEKENIETSIDLNLEMR
ncbi:AAA family ATPase [Spirulina subsalsa]|uniref:AAA family ATPase n=1 Tax=Spirulina subsalsa TaxID=54311 RepID=UPI0002EBAFDD|nr:AAA family ATPase [Spirulina subsalsa]